MLKLSQVLALEKEAKTQQEKNLTELYHLAQKNDLFNGLVRNYQKLDDKGEDLPAEVKKVQLNGREIPLQMKFVTSEYLDLSLTKDVGNCIAKADVVVDNVPIAKDIPVTYLLTLEKFLINLRTTIGSLPTLDPTEDWTWNGNEGCWKSGEAITHKTKKNQKAIVLYDATPEHPAQTQLITEDEVVGYWHIVKKSTALTEKDKKELFIRVEKLISAVKSAREEANSIKVEKHTIAQDLFTYILEA